MALTDNLRGYYKLNETSGTSAADSSGNGYTGTLDTYTFNSNGKLGYCVSGTTTGYGVNCGLVVNPGANQAFSINMWVNLTTISATNVFYGSVGGTAGYYGYLTSTGSFYINIYKDGTYGLGKSFTGVHTAIGTGSWKMLTFPYDGSGNASGMKFYINGVEYTTGLSVTQNTLSNQSPATGANFMFGSYTATNAYQIKGRIDECGAWYRDLTSTEISTLYNGGLGLTYPFSTSGFFNIM